MRGLRQYGAVLRILAFALIGFIFVLSPAPPSVAQTAARPGPVTVGYLAAFRGLDLSIARTDLAAFTHFNLAFANPDAQGRFVDGDTMACMGDETGANVRVDTLRATVARLRAGGAKLLVSTAGGVIPACSGDWRALLVPARRAATVAGLVDLVDTLGLDGVDIDIEGELLTAIDRDGNYIPFIAELSRAMRAHGKLLTCATASYEGGMIPVGSIPYFDLVNVMSYDAIGPTWGTPGVEHSSLAMAQADLAMWRKRGVARERLVLGVPFYGYGFGGERPNWPYRDLVAAYGDRAATGDRIGTMCADCRYITYNGPATIEAKAALAATQAGGVMVWELSQDSADHTLTSALQRGLTVRDGD